MVALYGKISIVFYDSGFMPENYVILMKKMWRNDVFHAFSNAYP